MSRDVRYFLVDIKESCTYLIAYTKDLSYDEFQYDRKTVQAVIKEMEIIGEAVKHLPDSLISDHPEINWKYIAGLRDVLVHHYFGINMKLIWTVVQDEIQPLLDKIDQILSATPPTTPA